MTHRPEVTGSKVGGPFIPKWDGHQTFTVEEAAEILGISRPSAYQAANNGDLPALRIGRRLIVPRQALERLLASV